MCGWPVSSTYRLVKSLSVSFSIWIEQSIGRRAWIRSAEVAREVARDVRAQLRQGGVEGVQRLRDCGRIRRSGDRFPGVVERVRHPFAPPVELLVIRSNIGAHVPQPVQ